MDATAARAATTKRTVLLVYYTYTGQALKMAEAMAEVFRDRGADVTLANIEFTDPRWVGNFDHFPMKSAFLGVLKMLPAQLRRATGEIEIPPEATRGDYDLVVVFSPTWWLTTSIPIRSFMKSDSTKRVLSETQFTDVVVCRRYWGNNHRTVRDLGSDSGGEYVEGIHFRYAGGQIRSLMSLISFLGSGAYREHYFGVPIPRTNLLEPQLREGQSFAGRLAADFGTGTASK